MGMVMDDGSLCLVLCGDLLRSMGVIEKKFLVEGSSIDEPRWINWEDGLLLNKDDAVIALLRGTS